MVSLSALNSAYYYEHLSLSNGTTLYRYVYGSNAPLNHGLLLLSLKSTLEDLVRQVDSSIELSILLNVYSLSS
jgi:hypothetical protein